MKIQELELINFHGFEKRHITLSDQFTVLVGDNGIGKTAILDGIAVALGAFFVPIGGITARNIKRNEIHLKQFRLGQMTDVQEQYPVEVRCQGIIDNNRITWSRAINNSGGSTTSKNAKEITEYAKRIQNEVRQGKDTILPVFCYYGTGRLWVQKFNREKKAKNPKKVVNNRFNGYKDCLIPASNEKAFLDWFEKMTYIMIQENQEPDILKAVKKAVSVCSNDWEDISYNIKDNQMIVKKKSGESLPFSLLSDGVRNIIGMVFDISHRMAKLNPSLGEDVIRETPGIVLIDELDLHLHPTWQRRIVEDLKRTFPKVQFITTSHSPFIIQSLEEGELRKLQFIDDDEEVEEELFIDKSIEEISEDVMGVNGVQRSDKKNRMFEVAQQYFRLLSEDVGDSEKLRELKEELDDIEAQYSGNVAFYAFLKLQRELSGR
ncbi:AAA family ATPase [Bacillus atrophaeus]|uniref:AAA family ATPase n=1 Tax=Bacillus atrophaeus TaxID=1452 RepID=UPI002E1EDBE6|nr:AAA family ATPase [Bacillus atrophaeus]